MKSFESLTNVFKGFLKVSNNLVKVLEKYPSIFGMTLKALRWFLNKKCKAAERRFKSVSEVLKGASEVSQSFAKAFEKASQTIFGFF